ncbi:MAG TPA: response regulator [Thermoanaerobaculia bacterium]|nr:response regulator [Thermoanaerobaculia bacterium]
MPKKILLADDSITIQKVVELTFSDGDYEVTAVNNGAKAIARLAEMRPDIILSDIIMPEKNGYEVCEYVKSHPEYRNIPVILLTGTFEPFDPDRADKAGCDAVVTKPFESQSLIHKVEELIQQSQSGGAASEPAPAAPSADPFGHDNDIFTAAPAATPPAAADMPFDAPSDAFSGETRAFSRMTFEDMQRMDSEPSAPATAPQPAMPEPEASPWDEPPAAFGGETRAFPRMSFEEMQQMATESQPVHAPEIATPFDAPAPAAPPPPEPSPWDEPRPDDASTRAIPKMSFEEMRQVAAESQPEPTPFEAPAPLFETPAPSPEPTPFETAAPSPEPTPFETSAPSPEHEPSPWDEQPAAFGGETRAFPRMSFEEMEQMAATPSPSHDPFAEPNPSESPFGVQETPEPAAEEPAWSLAAPTIEAASEPAVNSQITDATAVNNQITDEPAPAVNHQITDEPAVNPQITDAQAVDLTDEQVDRIARRVVQLMSEQVVRNIAWEVIPDLAEMVVKERIRQLEAEA